MHKIAIKDLRRTTKVDLRRTIIARQDLRKIAKQIDLRKANHLCMATINLSPKDAKIKLIDGNSRFISNKQAQKDFSINRREELFQNGQNPFAIIITCSDSRVPPECQELSRQS